RRRYRARPRQRHGVDLRPDPRLHRDQRRLPKLTVLDLPEALETERLRLRHHRPSDAPAIATLLDDWAVVRWLSEVPFPYTAADAEEWIEQSRRARIAGRDYQFVVTRAEDGVLIGHIGLRIAINGKLGELGYWFGRPFWGQG